MAVDLSIWGVLGAGILSFLSPCVLPLVPPYLCYMSGVSVDDLRRSDDNHQKSAMRLSLVIAAIAFVLGFATVFITLGASATTLGRFLNYYRSWFAIIAGIIIIIMGLNFLGLFRISLLSREARFQARSAPATPLGAYVMGLAFAFGWTPCIGPILGPIVGLAGSKQTVFEGAELLAVYSIGLGVPFLFAAIFSSAFMRFLAKFRVHLGKVEKIIGILLVIAGLLFLTGQMQTLSYWLLETFPQFSQIEGLSLSEVGRGIMNFF